MAKDLKPRHKNKKNDNLKLTKNFTKEELEFRKHIYDETGYDLTPENKKHLYSDDYEIIIESETKFDITKSDDLGLTLKDYNTLKNIDYTDIYRPSGIITTKEYEKLPSPEIESFEIWDYMGDDND